MVGLLEEPSDQFDYYVLYSGKEEQKDSPPSKSWNPKNKLNPKPPIPKPSLLPPYNQKVLPKMNKNLESKTTECNTFSLVLTSYSLDFHH